MILKIKLFLKIFFKTWPFTIFCLILYIPRSQFHNPSLPFHVGKQIPGKLFPFPHHNSPSENLRTGSAVFLLRIVGCRSPHRLSLPPSLVVAVSCLPCQFASPKFVLFVTIYVSYCVLLFIAHDCNDCQTQTMHINYSLLLEDGCFLCFGGYDWVKGWKTFVFKHGNWRNFKGAYVFFF